MRIQCIIFIDDDFLKKRCFRPVYHTNADTATYVLTMKSIIRYFSNNDELSLIFVILVYTTFISPTTSSPPSCGLYGAPPCRFLPAPPGQTPSCARPGRTYCERIDNYPTYLIKHLVHKWGYEAKNLLADETWDDFATLAWHDTPVFYDPSYIFPQHNKNINNNNNGKDFNGYNYEMPPYGNTNYNNDPYHYSKSSTTEGPTYLLYTSSSDQHLDLNKNHIASFGSSTAKATPNNPSLWLKRFVRDLSKKSSSFESGNTPLIIDTVEAAEGNSSTKSKQDVSINVDLWDIVGVDKGTSMRTKRQSPGRTTLCQTTSQFITPQAALNSKGNWMFVVNEASTARQTVKAELCASNTCTNLCQLPNGYNSRCEQKFVQKRLIALQGNGQNLYTDTFWFPSCCVCTISAN